MLDCQAGETFRTPSVYFEKLVTGTGFDQAGTMENVVNVGQDLGEFFAVAEIVDDGCVGNLIQVPKVRGRTKQQEGLATDCLKLFRQVTADKPIPTSNEDSRIAEVLREELP